MTSLDIFRAWPIRTVLNGHIVARLRELRPSATLAACSVALVCSLLLGGGTRGGFLSDALLELISIPVLLFALSSLISLPIWSTRVRADVHWVLAFCCAIVLLPLIQLVPLPPWIWTALPGHQQVAGVFDALGRQPPWMPLSVSPYSTWLSFLSLLPPMAIFLTAIQLGYRERRGLSLIIIAVGVLSVFLGLSQVAQGSGSELRFYTITNNTEAVGFFANRNHFAALLYAALLFAAVWAIDIGFKTGSWQDVRTFESATIVPVTAIFLVFVVVIAGEAMARSRAGLGLTMVALLAVFALAFADRRNAAGTKSNKLLIAAIVLAVMLSMQFALYRILGRFAYDPLENARLVFAHNTIRAAWAFMPFGSGLGTFVPVYAMFERPIDVIANTYANHAHDDFLETWLETGVVGPLLLCVALVWWGFSSVKLWRRPPADLRPFDCTLARAATVVIALLLMHSFVDYPMRTEAIMAVFAVCCALLLEPLTAATRAAWDAMPASRPQAHRKQSSGSPAKATAVSATAGAPVPARPRHAGGRWGEEIAWPDQWQNSAEPKRSGSGEPRPGTSRNPKSAEDDDSEPDPTR